MSDRRNFKEGDNVKVWLPGETPWATVYSILSDGRWVGDINNDLVNTAQHGISFGDRIVFRLEKHDHVSLWVPDQRQFDRRRSDRRITPGGARA